METPITPELEQSAAKAAEEKAAKGPEPVKYEDTGFYQPENPANLTSAELGNPFIGSDIDYAREHGGLNIPKGIPTPLDPSKISPDDIQEIEAAKAHPTDSASLSLAKSLFVTEGRHPSTGESFRDIALDIKEGAERQHELNIQRRTEVALSEGAKKGETAIESTVKAVTGLTPRQIQTQKEQSIKDIEIVAQFKKIPIKDAQNLSKNEIAELFKANVSVDAIAKTGASINTINQAVNEFNASLGQLDKEINKEYYEFIDKVKSGKIIALPDGEYIEKEQFDKQPNGIQQILKESGYAGLESAQNPLPWSYQGRLISDEERKQIVSEYQSKVNVIVAELKSQNIPDSAISKLVIDRIGDNPLKNMSESGVKFRRESITALSMITPPAKALLPEYTKKDITGLEWAIAAAQVASLTSGLVIAPFGGAAAGVNNAIQAGSTGVFIADLQRNWNKMSIPERGLAIALDTAFLGSVIKGMKVPVNTNVTKNIIKESLKSVKIPDQTKLQMDNALTDILTGIEKHDSFLIKRGTETLNGIGKTGELPENVARMVRDGGNYITENTGKLSKLKVSSKQSSNRVANEALDNSIVIWKKERLPEDRVTASEINNAVIREIKKPVPSNKYGKDISPLDSELDLAIQLNEAELNSIKYQIDNAADLGLNAKQVDSLRQLQSKLVLEQTQNINLASAKTLAWDNIIQQVNKASETATTPTLETFADALKKAQNLRTRAAESSKKYWSNRNERIYQWDKTIDDVSNILREIRKDPQVKKLDYYDTKIDQIKSIVDSRERSIQGNKPKLEKFQNELHDYFRKQSQGLSKSELDALKLKEYERLNQQLDDMLKSKSTKDLDVELQIRKLDTLKSKYIDGQTEWNQFTREYVNRLNQRVQILKDKANLELQKLNEIKAKYEQAKNATTAYEKDQVLKEIDRMLKETNESKEIIDDLDDFLKKNAAEKPIVPERGGGGVAVKEKVETKPKTEVKEKTAEETKKELKQLTQIAKREKTESKQETLSKDKTRQEIGTSAETTVSAIGSPLIVTGDHALEIEAPQPSRIESPISIPSPGEKLQEVTGTGDELRTRLSEQARINNELEKAKQTELLSKTTPVVGAVPKPQPVKAGAPKELPKLEPLPEIKPRIPPPVKTEIETSKRPLWTPDEIDKRKEEIKAGKYPITWKQGFLWVVIKYPYNKQSDISWSKTPPSGAVVIKGVGSAYKTILALGGNVNILLNIKVGAFTATVEKPRSFAGERGAIRFKRNKRFSQSDLTVKGVRI